MTLLGSAASTGIGHVRLRRQDGRATTLHLRARIADIADARDYIVIVDSPGD